MTVEGLLQVLTAVLVKSEGRQSKSDDGMGDMSRLQLRIVVTDNVSGEVKLETRLPSRFLAPITTIVPQLVRLPLSATVPSAWALSEQLWCHQ